MGGAADELRRAMHDAFERVRWTLDDLTDEELLWEPVPRCWSIRPRGEAAPGWGTGTWVCEDGWPPPEPPPVTTIGWRIAHLAARTEVYRDWTFGDARLALADLEIPTSAAAATGWLCRAQDDLAAEVAPLDDAGLAPLRPVHYGAHLPIGQLVASMVTEHVHHGAEIGVLRDLHRGHARLQPPPVRGER